MFNFLLTTPTKKDDLFDFCSFVDEDGTAGNMQFKKACLFYFLLATPAKKDDLFDFYSLVDEDHTAVKINKVVGNLIIRYL